MSDRGFKFRPCLRAPPPPRENKQLLSQEKPSEMSCSENDRSSQKVQSRKQQWEQSHFSSDFLPNIKHFHNKTTARGTKTYLQEIISLWLDISLQRLMLAHVKYLCSFSAYYAKYVNTVFISFIIPITVIFHAQIIGAFFNKL